MKEADVIRFLQNGLYLTARYHTAYRNKMNTRAVVVFVSMFGPT